jgi:hypothetical protein
MKNPAIKKDNDGLPILEAALAAGAIIYPKIAAAKTLLDVLWSSEDARYERAATEYFGHLSAIVGDLQQYFSDPWLKSELGQQFWEKVFAAALEAHAAGKRKEFAFLAVNGVRDKTIADMEKLQFVDTLRKLSAVSLAVLAEMEEKWADKLKRKEFPPVSAPNFIQDTRLPLDPHAINAAIHELISAGLFSKEFEWTRSGDGRQHSVGSYTNNVAYTSYTRRFVRYISTQIEIPGENP